MFCEKCGKEIKDGAKFCAHCGAAQTSKTMPRVQAVSQPVKQAGADYGAKSKKSKAPLLVGVGVVAIAAAGYFVGIPMLHHHQWKTNMQAAAECLASEDYSGALQALEAADEAEADRQETALQFARAYAGSGNYDQAKEYLQKISDDVVENYPQEINKSKIDSDYFTNEWNPKKMRENPEQLLLGKYSYYNRAEGEDSESISILSYSEPDKDTYCITRWSYYANGSRDIAAQYTYDKDWKLIEAYDSSSFRPLTKYYYDENGSLVEADCYNGDNIEQKLEYKDGNCIQRTHYVGYNDNGIFDDSISLVNKSEYDENGNQISNIFYDADENMDTEYDNTIRADYDEYGNCTAETHIGYGRNFMWSYIYSYDENGNVLTEESYLDGVYSGRWIYEYDEAGNKKTATYEDEEGRTPDKMTYNANGTIAEWIHYYNGNMTSRHIYTNKNGYLAEEHYNSNNSYSDSYYYTTLALLKATMVE